MLCRDSSGLVVAAETKATILPDQFELNSYAGQRIALIERTTLTFCFEQYGPFKSKILKSESLTSKLGLCFNLEFIDEVITTSAPAYKSLEKTVEPFRKPNTVC